MNPISDGAALISLEALAAQIRGSSNFRFSWQWFSLGAPMAPSPRAARSIFDKVISQPECHRFLRDSLEDSAQQTFEIAPLHQHCIVEDTTSSFAGTLARAATDRLGAYSRTLVEASPAEVEAVRRTFAPAFPYSAFELQPGNRRDCAGCAGHNNHLFTSWFYGVAWDWCFCLLPHDKALAWVGCLTDTD